MTAVCTKGDATALSRRKKVDSAFLTRQIITYLGNKRALLPQIGEAVEQVKRSLGRSRVSFFDAFSGSGIVSRYMKFHSSFIVANDLERYGEVISRCYLTNRSDVDKREMDEAFSEWSSYASRHRRSGYITNHYAPVDDNAIKPGERVFYTHENAVVLDSARAALDKVVPSKFFNLFLGPLLASASVHANTAGVFKGFYKDRRGVGAFGGAGKNALTRICGRIELEKPVLSDYDCESLVLRGDANEIVHAVPSVDLAYFDPPYNQHPYGSNYFMLNVLAENREPADISRVSGIPGDWNRSRYNRRAGAADALFELLAATPAKYLLVSYNSEGFIPYAEFVRRLRELGEVKSARIEYNAFRGSRNLSRRPLKVTEYLFTVRRK